MADAKFSFQEKGKYKLETGTTRSYFKLLLTRELFSNFQLYYSTFIGKNYHPQWMAPEALQKSPKTINVKAADMWSFAVLLWELSAREVPFAHLSPMEAGMKVLRDVLSIYNCLLWL